MAHASVDTFDIDLGFPVVVTLMRDGIMSDVDSAMIQHRQRMSSVFPNGHRLVRRFQVASQTATLADFHRAQELYAETKGGCEPLDITLRGLAHDGGAPETETIQVRIVDQPLVLQSVGTNVYSFSMLLEEFGHAP